MSASEIPRCECGAGCRQLESRKAHSLGRRFWGCGRYGPDRCNYFRWVDGWEPADAEFVAADDEVEYEEGYGSEDMEEDAPASPPRYLRRSRRKRPPRRATRVQVLDDDDVEEEEAASPAPKKTRPAPASGYTIYGADAVLIPAGLAGYIDAARVPPAVCHICGLDRIDVNAPEVWHVAAALVDKMNAPVPFFPVCDECARRTTNLLLEGGAFVLYGDIAKPTAVQRTAKRN